MIQTTREGTVSVLRMCHGKANALDVEFCEALERALATEETGSARALVLTGTGGIFCAGVDLRRLLAEGPTYATAFLPALDALFMRLLRFDKPLVGALNGHAIAGGAVIAAGCDLRVLARGNATVGVPELKVGVSFPATALELTRELFSPALLGPALYQGRIWNAAQCASDGLVHELVEPGDLHSRAIELARALGDIPPLAFARTKRLRRQPSLDTLEKHRERNAAQALEIWSSPETHAALAEYVAHTLGAGKGR